MLLSTIRRMLIGILAKQSNMHLVNSLVGWFGRGAFWSMSGTVVTQGLALVVSIVTAGLLGKTGFGEFGMIYSTALTFGSMAGLGLGMTATRYLAEWRNQDPQRSGRIIGLSLGAAFFAGAAISLLVFCFAEQLAKQTLNAPHLTKELQLSSLIFSSM